MENGFERARQAAASKDQLGDALKDLEKEAEQEAQTTELPSDILEEVKQPVELFADKTPEQMKAMGAQLRQKEDARVEAQRAARARQEAEQTQAAIEKAKKDIEAAGGQQ